MIKGNLLSGEPASKEITKRIAEFPDWRGEALARMRALVLSVDKRIVEEWKWNVPVWSLNGMICTGEVYKKAVKLTFAKGASLPDPTPLFNSSLEAGTRRALDIHEGETVPAAPFKKLIKAAIAKNLAPK